MFTAAFEEAAWRAPVLPAGSCLASAEALVTFSLPLPTISVRFVMVAGGVIAAPVAVP
jgi:hypothetical protein